MKNNNIFMLTALMVVAVSSCDNDSCEEQQVDNGKKVELNVVPTLAMTRSIVDGTDASVLGSVAVHASGTGYTAGNNYAVYSYANSSWSNNGTDKIYLSNETATITAHYPASATATNGSIAVGVLDNGNVDVSRGDASTVYGAENETDYMWATVENTAGASTSTTNRAPSVKLIMNHALARVSFRIYKDAVYRGTVNLSKLELNNAGAGTVLDKGTNPTLNISDGAITMNAPVAASYTRAITGYHVATVADEAKAVSMLVFPVDNIAADAIEVKFTIDNVEYSTMVSVPDGGSWLAGKNYLYTVKLSGTGLVISSVELVDWSDVSVTGELGVD